MFRAKRNSVLAVFVLLLVFIFSFLITSKTANLIPLCFFKYMTQLDCPGCGLTRSFVALSHGHWIEALKFNLLGPFIYLYFLLYLIQHSLNLILKNGFKFSWHLSRWPALFFIILLFTQWFYKIAKQSYQHFIS